MHSIVAMSVALSIIGLVLVACSPPPPRQWPTWTNGDLYNNLNYEPGSR